MDPSHIITLTTDFGLHDPYVAMMKGVILSIHSKARIIDVTHQIQAGAIIHAAGIVLEVFPFFPKGTVHVAVIDPGVGSDRRLIGLEAGGHFFVGPDNGIFWPVIENHKEAKIVHLIENDYFLSVVSQTFHGRDVFAPVAAYLSRGVALEQMGPKIDDPHTLVYPSPREKADTLYGRTTRVDHFGNLITNIHRKSLNSFLESAQPVIEVGNLVIKKLSHTYSDVGEGEPLALINSSEWLEIAVRLGRASEYVELKSEELLGTEVRVKKTRELL